jgi:hypothetical protein
VPLRLTFLSEQYIHITNVKHFWASGIDAARADSALCAILRCASQRPAAARRWNISASQPQNFQPQCAPTHFSTAATPASSVHYWQLNKKMSKSGKSLTHQKVSKK